MLPRSPNGFATVSDGVVSVPSPLNWSTSTIAFGTQGVPGTLVGGRVKPLAEKTYVPVRSSGLHLGSPVAKAGAHSISRGTAAAKGVLMFFTSISRVGWFVGGSV